MLMLTVTVTAIFLCLSLLSSQILAVPTTSKQSKHARWALTPRTLQDPDFLKRDKLAVRDVGFSQFDKWAIFKRACSSTQVTCAAGDCCPTGDYCIPYNNRSECCLVGEICLGPPVGCADPTQVECPASIGGCCPVGQLCYLDSAGTGQCDNAGLFSTTITTSTPPYTPPVVSAPIVTVTPQNSTFPTPTTPVDFTTSTSTSTTIDIVPTTVTTSSSIIPNATSTQIPFTSGQPTSISSPSLVNPSSLFQLFNCAPCGGQQCSFAPSGNIDDTIYRIRVGTPVSNCNSGSTGNIVTTITGDLTLSDTWSVSLNVGLNIGALRLGTTANWSQTQASTVEHSIAITVAPGQMGVMVANVQYKSTPGVMQVDPAQAAISLISNQPLTVISYDQEIVQCGSSFSANDSQPFQCSSDNKSSCAWGFPAICSLIGTLLFILWA